MPDLPQRAALALLGVLVAASVASADKLVFSGTHGVTFSPNFKLPAEITGTDIGVATVNGGTSGSSILSTLQLSQDFTQLNTQLGIDPTAASALYGKIKEVRLTNVRIDPQVAGGLFAPILANFQAGTPVSPPVGTLPAAGTVRLCKIVGCGSAFTVPLGQAIGVGGSFTVGGSMNPTRFTVVGEPWTVNTAKAQYQTVTSGTAMQIVTMTQTGMGFVQGMSGATGTTLDPTTSPMSGTVQLVTAVQIHATGIPGPNALSGQIIRLTLHFQPEPKRLMLLSSGAAGLLLLGLRRRHS